MQHFEGKRCQLHIFFSALEHSVISHFFCFSEPSEPKEEVRWIFLESSESSLRVDFNSYLFQGWCWLNLNIAPNCKPSALTCVFVGSVINQASYIKPSHLAGVECILPWTPECTHAAFSCDPKRVNFSTFTSADSAKSLQLRMNSWQRTYEDFLSHQL